MTTIAMLMENSTDTSPAESESDDNLLIDCDDGEETELWFGPPENPENEREHNHSARISSAAVSCENPAEGRLFMDSELDSVPGFPTVTHPNPIDALSGPGDYRTTQMSWGTSPSRTPLGFTLNGKPVNLTGEARKVLSFQFQPKGSACGFTLLQMEKDSWEDAPNFPETGTSPVIIGVVSGEAAQKVLSALDPPSHMTFDEHQDLPFCPSTSDYNRPCQRKSKIKRPNCPDCGSRFKKIQQLRGFMCLCSTDIALSLQRFCNYTFKESRGMGRKQLTTHKTKRTPPSTSKYTKVSPRVFSHARSRRAISPATISPPRPPARDLPLSQHTSGRWTTHSPPSTGTKATPPKPLAPRRSKASATLSSSTEAAGTPLPAFSTSPSSTETPGSLQQLSHAPPPPPPPLLPPPPPPPLHGDKPVIHLDDFYYGSDATCGQAPPKELPWSTFVCNYCSGRLHNNLGVMAHVREHLREMLWRHRGGPGALDTTCQHCYRDFGFTNALQHHVEVVHSQLADSTAVCRICELAYENKPAFLQHMKNIHNPGEMPYICQVCGYRSSYHSSVLAHFNEAHADKCYFLCPYCLKVLRNSSIFQNHYAKHQRKEAFACDKCRLSFLYYIEHKVHSNQHHLTHIKPAQLNGLKPGTTVTVRSCSVVGGPLPDGVSKKEIPISQVIQVHPSTSPQEAHRGICVENMHPKSIKKSAPAASSCVECLLPVAEYTKHFLMRTRCSLCTYVTCCSEAYTSHMITSHADPSTTAQYKSLYQLYPRLPSRLRCVSCGFTSSIGDIMANHLMANPRHSAKQEQDKKDPMEHLVNGEMELHKPHSAPGTRADRKASQSSVRDGAFVPIHLLTGGTRSTQLSVQRLCSGRRSRLCSSHAATIRILRPRQDAVEVVSPLGQDQLQAVLYALCNGLHQAACRFHTEPALIRTWTLQQQQRAQSRWEWHWNMDQVAQWVLTQREQQLPIDEEILLQMAMKMLGRASDPTEPYEWAVNLILHHNLSLQSCVLGERTLLPRNLHNKACSYTSFLNGEVKIQGFRPYTMGAMDELLVFTDPAQFATEAPSALQLFGTSQTPPFEIVLSGLADGTFFHPLLFVRCESTDLPEGFPDNVLLEARPDGFTDEQRLDFWVNKLWRPHVNGRGRDRGLLIVDAHRGHLTAGFLGALNSTHTLPAIIPVGCSSHLQPLDISVTPVVREFLQARWSQLLSQGGAEGLCLRQLALTLACWLSEVATTLREMPHILSRSFSIAATTTTTQDEERQREMVQELTEALVGLPEPDGHPEELKDVVMGGEEDRAASSDATVGVKRRSQDTLRALFLEDDDLRSFHGFEETEGLGHAREPHLTNTDSE